MTSSEYRSRREDLLECLVDAEIRGDIYLEYDVKELLVALDTEYYLDEEEV